jgi:hypothetical protein
VVLDEFGSPVLLEGPPYAMLVEAYRCVSG